MSKYIPTFIAAARFLWANRGTVYHVLHSMATLLLLGILLYRTLHGGVVTQDELDKVIKDVLGQ